MSDKKIVAQPDVCSVCTFLFMLFLILKLTNTIDWSWWWITAPLWIPLCVVVGCILLALVILGIVVILNEL